MSFKIITPYIFTILVMPLQISAQTYVLNPHNVEIGSVSRLPMDAKTESQWLKSFLKQTSLLNNLETAKMSDSASESLNEKIKKASQAYLELKFDDAQNLADEALAFVGRQWPYAKMQKDAQEIFAIQLMASDSEAHSNALPAKAMAFANDSDFTNSLPMKFQSAVAEYKKTSREITSKNFNQIVDRFFVFGKERQLPITLTTGQWLVHILHEDELSAYWMNIDESANPEIKINRIWTKSIWKSIPHATLKAQLLATRPQTLSPGGVTVIVREKNHEATPLLVSSSADDTSILKNAPIESSRSQWPNDFTTQIKEESNSSILKSPWFWAIAGSVAGLSGYFAYQSMQPHTVKTR